MTPWRMWKEGAHPAAWNMAVDAALLETASTLSSPLLRFYAWTEDAATFGYSQDFGVVQTMTRLRPLVRRPTGGGIVEHDADWTYSVVVPACDPWHALSARESYRKIHEWMREAFAAACVATELSPCCAREAPGRCFAGAERHDLLLDGRKIAGAAQRRTRCGLLIQGSVRCTGTGVLRGAWERGVVEAMRGRGVEWEDFIPGAALLQRADELEHARYRHPERRRTAH